MAAAINFYAGQGAGVWVDLSSSGIGFFGASAGTSVQVGQYQNSSFVSDGEGDTNGGYVQVTNCKYDTTDGSGVIVNGDVAVVPSAMVVNSGTMNIRFTFDSLVQTQDVQLRIFDRVAITNGATGVTTKVLQITNGGSGVSSSGTVEALADHQGWIAPSGSGTIVNLLSSAGSGGLCPSGVDTTDTRHDWYVGLSASPLSIGAKQAFGIYTQLEYL